MRFDLLLKSCHWAVILCGGKVYICASYCACKGALEWLLFHKHGSLARDTKKREWSKYMQHEAEIPWLLFPRMHQSPSSTNFPSPLFVKQAFCEGLKSQAQVKITLITSSEHRQSSSRATEVYYTTVFHMLRNTPIVHNILMWSWNQWRSPSMAPPHSWMSWMQSQSTGSITDEEP